MTSSGMVEQEDDGRSECLVESWVLVTVEDVPNQCLDGATISHQLCVAKSCQCNVTDIVESWQQLNTLVHQCFCI